MENHNHSEKHEGNFYKGLFFGLMLGVGLVWFASSKTGKEFVQTLRKRIDETLSAEPGMEDYEEEETTEPLNSEVESTPQTKRPRRFFRKK